MVRVRDRHHPTRCGHSLKYVIVWQYNDPVTLNTSRSYTNGSLQLVNLPVTAETVDVLVFISPRPVTLPDVWLEREQRRLAQRKAVPLFNELPASSVHRQAVANISKEVEVLEVVRCNQVIGPFPQRVLGKRGFIRQYRPTYFEA